MELDDLFQFIRDFGSVAGQVEPKFIISFVVVLQPDVAKVFPNAQAVNESLRALAGIIRRQKGLASK